MGTERNKMEKTGFREVCSSIVSGTISCFLLILVFVFPLIYDRSYFNILETKYKCYYIVVIGMAVVLLVLAIAMAIIDLVEYKGKNTLELLGRLAPRRWKTTFGVADVAVLAFWFIAIISTLCSDYVFEAFWGNEGRYTGLFLLSLYMLSYFMISRFWTVKGWILEAFLTSALIVCLIGITDYFQLDILGFRGRIKPEQSTIFVSTIGNINTYTAYIALMIGLASALFATAKSKIKVIWYFVCTVIGFMAIVMGCSDNAYLALGALFAFLPFFLFKSRTGVRRYLVLVASFATVIQVIDVINQQFPEMVIGLDSLFQVLVNFEWLLQITVVLWMAVISLFYYDKKSVEEHQEKLDNRLWYAWVWLVALGMALVCFMVYDANVAGNGARYGALGNYLVFNDSWGTNRGYIWRKALELYQEFSPLHKLFGYGPDTFGILTTNEIKIEMVNATGQVFDSAHNEYLQYLVTIGPAGLLAYVTFLISSGARFYKKMLEKPYVAGCCVAVLCYGAQALVNLNLPIATPMMWLLLSVGMAGCRERKELLGK